MAANGYRHDFDELFNRGTQASSLVGWTLQVRAVGTSTWITWPLSGSIAGNSYVLVRLGQAANPVDGNDLPTPYLTGTAVDIENGTSVALVSSTSAIAPDTCPTGPVDLFGAYIAPCKEAAGFFGGPGYNEAFGRGNVCVDTNDNGADFMSEPISTSNPPRTSSTALHTCP